ncbi:MAG TPA: hypothetical protein DCZ63_09670 [Geobacter sp.]|nr:MAG: hypothetical protein A2X48_00785 [Lentisphaerae bacterium GWF2_49_21]HBA72428.1 hypothetical protein [Geobacter sp.]
MSPQRVFGIVLLIIGVILLTIGLNASQSAVDRWSNFFTGHFTDATVWYIVVGISAAVGGMMMVLFGMRGRHA